MQLGNYSQLKIGAKIQKKIILTKKNYKIMYYVYKNCDLVRKFKTKKHAVRMANRLIKRSHVLYHLVEIMNKETLIFWW